MPKTLREQLPTLIELFAISGWTITILPTSNNVFRVEGQHEKHGNATTSNEGRSLDEALAPFEEELHESTRRAERGIHPPERLHCGQLSNRLTSDIDWCPACDRRAARACTRRRLPRSGLCGATLNQDDFPIQTRRAAELAGEKLLAFVKEMRSHA